MSRSLNRIRSLVSEIEQIQKRGQLGSGVVLGRSVSEFAKDLESEVAPEFVVTEAKEPLAVAASPKVETGATVLNFNSSRSTEPVESETKRGRVAVQFSGSVVLELQIENSAERIELKQVGDSIEIRFQDGKAFHIPFKAVA